MSPRSYWIVSFPKSGRTWLRRILQELGLDLETTHARSGYGDALHFDQLSTAASSEMDRFLLFLRDPRDTAVSGYHWLRTNVDQSYQGTLSEFIRDPRYGIEKIARFNLMWSALQHHGMMALTYERLHAETVASVAKVLSFFDVDASDASIRRAIANNTFAEMRKRELMKVDKRLAKAGGGSVDPNSLKARSGKVGSHKAEFSDEDREYCECLLESLNYFENITLSINMCVTARLQPQPPGAGQSESP